MSLETILHDLEEGGQDASFFVGMVVLPWMTVLDFRSSESLARDFCAIASSSAMVAIFFSLGHIP